MYHTRDELQKTTTRGLEMYWAYAGRTNNNNKISPSEMLTILASAESCPPSLGGTGTGEDPLRLPGLDTLSEPHTNQCYGARKAGT
jgi:hypothetical protein